MILTISVSCSCLQYSYFNGNSMSLGPMRETKIVSNFDITGTERLHLDHRTEEITKPDNNKPN